MNTKKIKAEEYMNWDKTITKEQTPTPLEALKEIKTRRYNLYLFYNFPHPHQPSFNEWFENECCKDLKIIERALEKERTQQELLDCLKETMRLEVEGDSEWGNLFIQLANGNEHLVARVYSKKEIANLKEILDESQTNS